MNGTSGTTTRTTDSGRDCVVHEIEKPGEVVVRVTRLPYVHGRGSKMTRKDTLELRNQEAQ